METHLIMLRDAFDASRIAGVNVRELVDAGVPVGDMDLGFATYFNICPSWEPGTEWPGLPLDDGYPLIGMMNHSCPAGYCVSYSVFDKWHFYLRIKV